MLGYSTGTPVHKSKPTKIKTKNNISIGSLSLSLNGILT